MFIDYNVSKEGRQLKLFLLLIMDVIAVLANGFFLINVCYRIPIRRLESRTFVHFSYVSLTNLLTALFVIPFASTSFATGQWTLGSGVCYFNGIMTSFCLTSCIYSITILSIHKYITVVSPMQVPVKYRTLFYRIGVSIFLSFMVSLIPFIESRVYFNPYTGLCAVYLKKRKTFYTLFIVATTYIIPTVVNVLIYVQIFKALRQHEQRLRRNSIPNRVSIKSQKETMQTLHITFALFMLSWTPFFVYALLSLTEPAERVSNTFLVVAYFCGFLNSTINPFVFIFRNIKFRTFWSWMCGKPKPKVSVVSTVSKLESSGHDNLVFYDNEDNINKLYNKGGDLDLCKDHSSDGVDIDRFEGSFTVEYKTRKHSLHNGTNIPKYETSL